VRPWAASRVPSCRIPSSSVRPPRPTDGPADLEDVPAVQAGRRLEDGHAQSEGAGRSRAAGGLAAARRRAGPGDDSQVVHDDEGVLHERGVGVLVGGLDDHRCPACCLERGDVGMVLRPGDVDVDGTTR
jgi:hypothetical protein